MKKKLTLNRETLRSLKDSQIGAIAGASNAASGCTSCSPSTCYTQCCLTLTCGCKPDPMSVGCPPASTASRCCPPPPTPTPTK
jgi:hypothetical protein